MDCFPLFFFHYFYFLGVKRLRFELLYSVLLWIKVFCIGLYVQLAVEYGIKFLETSAKANVNVEEAFFTLARDIKVKMDKKLVGWVLNVNYILMQQTIL